MPKDDFTEIALVVDPKEKLVLVPITSRETSDGPKFSFALLREFTRNGETARTPWFFARHIAGIRRALDQIENWFEAEAKKGRK